MEKKSEKIVAVCDTNGSKAFNIINSVDRTVAVFKCSSRKYGHRKVEIPATQLIIETWKNLNPDERMMAFNQIGLDK